MSSEVDRPLLFTPIQLNGVIARNRVVVSPMCQYDSDQGGPTDWHLVHLGQFAIGGAGIIFCEETSVEERGRKTYGCSGIYRESQIPAHRRVNDFLRSHGAVPAIQIGHAGREASGCPPWQGYRKLSAEDAEHGQPPWETVGPSRVSAKPEIPLPRALSISEIKELIAAWREAALRSAEAGYDILEIHAAHGYLIHQFLSPVANQRDDAYGGDLQGRMRLCLEIIEAVRSAWPADKPLFLRVSAVDGTGQWTLDDTVTLAQEAKARGVNVVTTSSGGISGGGVAAVVPRVPGYQVPFAERVRREAGVMTLAVGLITEAHQAEAILQNGQADMVALAREMLWNPRWAVTAAKELGVPDHLELLPHLYSWWLKRREEIRVLTKG
jgi:2,4-dienoyl-CoA reductase-like NADH-dependent reductase (Old Yellow Enzyme family)